MTNLSEKHHWDSVHKNNGMVLKNLLKFPIIKDILIWFHNWEFYKICSKYIKPAYQNIFEVGCAPGNYLIKFHELFWLHPNGIEYSEPWIQVLKENFTSNHIDANIIPWDFFDPHFLETNEWLYDVVYSMGFIEHFDNPSISIENHFKIAKKWGLVIVVIPNLTGINKVFTEKAILDIHNLSIMDNEVMKSLFEKYEILESWYLGWLFNIGLFCYKNPILEKIRFFFFMIQRLFIDPIYMILYKIWINFSNKYTSPSLIVVCRKN